MFFYLGQRIVDDAPLEYTLSEEEMGKSWVTVDKQLQNHTVLDLVHAKKQGKQILSDSLDVHLSHPSSSSALISLARTTSC